MTFRVNENERSRLKAESLKAGLPTEEFIRRLIMGVELRPRPPEQLTELLRQLSAVGNNINQIARIANTTGLVIVKDIDSIRSMQSQIWQMVKAL